MTHSITKLAAIFVPLTVTAGVVAKYAQHKHTQKKDTSQPTSSNDSQAPGIGDVVTVGKLSYEVNSSRVVQQMIDYDGSMQSFIILNMTITNNGDEAVRQYSQAVATLHVSPDYPDNVVGGLYNASIGLAKPISYSGMSDNQLIPPHESLTTDMIFPVTESVAKNRYNTVTIAPENIYSHQPVTINI